MTKKKNVSPQDYFEESLLVNSRTFTNYYNRLENLALNMFEWKNVPPSIDVRFLELTLYEKGMAIFFKDDVLDYLALETMIGGVLNVYRIPTHRTAYSANGYNRPLNDKNSVLIFSNYLHTPTISTIELFAMRLAQCTRVIDVNIEAQKTPTLISCDETQRLTLLNLYKNYSGNVPVIFGDKALDLKGIDCIKTDAPFVADKIEEIKKAIWFEAMTFLGIENNSTDKKERVITDEVSTNLGVVAAERFVMLNSRRQAAEQINNMFGLDISVDFRKNSEVIETLQNNLQNPKEGAILE